LKGTWCGAAAETASGGNVEGAPIDVDMETARWTTGRMSGWLVTWLTASDQQERQSGEQDDSGVRGTH
jgi:hypothetical protein